MRADECDDIVKALNKRMDQIRATRKEGDKLPTLCARMGRISGLSAAVSTIADECFEGSKRDETMRSAANTEHARDRNPLQMSGPMRAAVDRMG